jgi:hypothetical protein
MGYEVEESQGEYIEYLEKQLAELDKYFTSGNDVPVERAVIHAKDYWKIRGMGDE